jgi:hypothetical protein
VLGVVAACESKPAAKKDVPALASTRDALGSDAPRVPVDAAVDAAGTAAGKTFVTGAGRCGECHEKMFDEWEVSAHAQAETSDLYRLTRTKSNDATCDRCHAPLAAAIGKDSVATEGVTCDVCHTLRDPVPSAKGGEFRIAIDDMVKFGPRCDLKDHYFHRMGCSPEHSQAVICGSCHWWEPKGIPVFTEFKDWRDGPAAKANESCQSCHMPKEKAVIAVGSPMRTNVPHHGLLGLAKDLRARAVALEVTAKDDAGAIVVDIAVTNATAGHYIPAGLPERRLVVRTRELDATGAPVQATATKAYLGRVLGDASGALVPFWLATQVVSDSRIAPGATWRDQVRFTPKATGAIEVEVLYEGLDPAIAEQLGVKDVEQVVLAKAKVPFGAASATGRAQLPKTVTVKPAAAGKRPVKKGAP